MNKLIYALKPYLPVLKIQDIWYKWKYNFAYDENQAVLSIFQKN